MSKFFLVLSMTIFLFGCETSKKIELQTKGTPINIIHPSPPSQASLEDYKVINLNNEVVLRLLYPEKTDGEIDEMLKDLQTQIILIAVTPKDYEKIINNAQEMKRIIAEQKEIIIFYKKITTEIEKSQETCC